MSGKQKGIFLVSCSNGSKVQMPSLRVRLASNEVCVFASKYSRSQPLQWMRNNPQSDERKALEAAMTEQGYTRDDVLVILSK